MATPLFADKEEENKEFFKCVKDKPFSKMSDLELLQFVGIWLGKRALDGMGSFVVSRLLEELVTRPGKSLETLLNEQLQDFERIVGQKIEENELRKMRALTEAVSMGIDDYKHTPQDDLLGYLTTKSQELEKLLEAFGRPAFKTYLLCANLNLTVWSERLHRWPDQAHGTQRNILKRLDGYIAYSDNLLGTWKSELPYGDVKENIVQRPGRSGDDEWIYTLYVYPLDIIDKLQPYGATEQEIRTHLSDMGYEVYGVSYGLTLFKEWRYQRAPGESQEEAEKKAAKVEEEATKFRDDEVDWAWKYVLNKIDVTETIDEWKKKRAEIQVRQAYCRVLERPVDPSGFLTYTNTMVATEWPVRWLVHDLAMSAEHQSRFIEGKTPGEVIGTLCNHLLAPDVVPSRAEDCTKHHSEWVAMLEAKGIDELIGEILDFYVTSGGNTVPGDGRPKCYDRLIEKACCRVLVRPADELWDTYTAFLMSGRFTKSMIRQLVLSDIHKKRFVDHYLLQSQPDPEEVIRILYDHVLARSLLRNALHSLRSAL